MGLKMLRNIKDKFMDYSFGIALACLTILAISKFNNFMDIYEIIILIGSAITFTWMASLWPNFKKLFVYTFLLSFISIFFYKGSLDQIELNFFLKYFLSSQSAIMWMTALYPLSLVTYWVYLFSRQEFYGNLATKITWLATMMGFIGLLVRWYESYLIGIDVGHIPVSNLYEVFVLFCLITSLLYLHYEEKLEIKKLGAFVLIIITAAVAFILWYTFEKGANEIQPLVPALQSYWMKIHVPANFIGYGAFAMAAMISVAYLLKDKSIMANYLPDLDVLDELTYKAISIGFIFFTIATILGAVWAAEAWGGYWSWDPKETWALIVWLNYAAWLHLRLIKGLRGTVLAWWSLMGLIVTTFAFLGVNLFLSGLHSYGEL
jgi:cytochrome c-type biogenesis protein CcsB|tara:strand:+ start:760 stop:1887 length:1128 start_codon:yes stop_codon:yes gene_type:complete